MHSRHAETVARTSPLFRAAIVRGDAGDALLFGKRILFACQEHVRTLGHEANTGNLLQRITSPGQRAGAGKVDTQEVAHYEAVAETVAVAMKRMGLRGIDESAAFSVEEKEEGRMAEKERQGEGVPQELHEINSSLARVSSLYEVVAGIVRQADPLVERFSGNIDRVEPRVQKASHEILTYYAEGSAAAGVASCGRLCLVAAVVAATTIILSFA